MLYLWLDPAKGNNFCKCGWSQLVLQIVLSQFYVKFDNSVSLDQIVIIIIVYSAFYPFQKNYVSWLKSLEENP